MNSKINKLEIALKIASLAHSNQKDKNGVAYINHLLTVSKYCKQEESQIVALLHDVIEDTNVTYKDLLSQGIDSKLIYAIKCLTKQSKLSELNYHQRIITSDIALEVKLCDMYHNSDKSRWPKNKTENAEENYLKYCLKAYKLSSLVNNQKLQTILNPLIFEWIENIKNNIIDIYSKGAYPANVLSNFYHNEFIIDGIKCTSMESFLQSLKYKNIRRQRAVCLLEGKVAKHNAQAKKWFKKQVLWWRGQKYNRHSLEYQNLLIHAYQKLAMNLTFRQALISSNPKILIHSIGKQNPKETILTEHEFCDFLTSLRKNI